MSGQAERADAIVVGAGLAGLATAAELAEAGKRVLLVEQEPEQSLGGQAHWSLGGLFLVDSVQQRRMGVRDSVDLALQDWMGTAGFDRPEDAWPRKWAEAYVDFATGEKKAWLKRLGISFFPVVGWAERGGALAGGHGNSVPRFHIAWGTGPGVVAPFARRVHAGAERGRVRLCFRHRVEGLVLRAGAVSGVRGTVLAPSDAGRGRAGSQEAVGEFEFSAQAVVVTSGGIGGNLDLVRRNWPERLGEPPRHMLSGVPEHVDGRMLAVAESSGARVVNRDRMWHYTEGITNWDPVWARHGIRILPGPSSLWVDATGKRLPAPNFPGFDTLSTLEHIMRSGYEYTWFVLSQKIIEKEFGLSGSEQNPDLTGRDLKLVAQRVLPGAPGPVEAFKRNGADFAVARRLPALIEKMRAIAGDGALDAEILTGEVVARDREMANGFTKDLQVMSIHNARAYRGDRLGRVASPHQILDPGAGPLIAVRLHLLTRKTLGGLHTDLQARVLGADGDPLPGLYAAGEVAGFGGGGMHGYRALEGTFLGGCIFSGRTAGRAAAAALV